MIIKNFYLNFWTKCSNDVKYFLVVSEKEFSDKIIELCNNFTTKTVDQELWILTYYYDVNNDCFGCVMEYKL